MALMHVNFFSDVLGMCMNMDVIIPQKTSGNIGMNGVRKEGRYPTLFLLHGLSDDHTVWQRKTSIERYVNDLGMAVVLPDVHRSFYTNMVYGGDYWTYISEELPAICREFFPNMSRRREDTYAAGLSMGGYGAFKLALRKPEMFGAAVSLSGVLDLASEAEKWSDEQEERKRLFTSIFGPGHEVAGTENDLLAVAEQLVKSGKPMPKLYAWCGRQDFLYEGNIRAAARLKELGIDLTFEESEGDHRWDCWDAKIERAVEWITNETR